MRSHRVIAVVAVTAVLGLFAVGPTANAKENELVPKHVLKSFGTANANGNADKGDAKPVRPGGGTTNGISYHGGPVMVGTTTHAYIVWYGNWGSLNPAAGSILTDLLSSIGGSPYFNINTTYFNGSNVKVSNSVSYGGSTTDNYSRGASLSDASILAITSDAITSGRLPKDPNGVYFVLTSSDVGETSGFLSQYCGWHTHGSVTGTDIKYSFVGDPSANLSACSVQSTSPNGNAAADAMASVISHELEEAVTDPDLNAWYDTRGYENADKCAWTFGTTSLAANGSKYNMTLGARQFLIQRNRVNASGGYCAVTYP